MYATQPVRRVHAGMRELAAFAVVAAAQCISYRMEDTARRRTSSTNK
eukprot:COSAG02_NODE_65189_length_258_cov_1.295597_1_plen_46_part_01